MEYSSDQILFLIMMKEELQDITVRRNVQRKLTKNNYTKKLGERHT